MNYELKNIKICFLIKSYALLKILLKVLPKILFKVLLKILSSYFFQCFHIYFCIYFHNYFCIYFFFYIFNTSLYTSLQHSFYRLINIIHRIDCTVKTWFALWLRQILIFRCLFHSIYFFCYRHTRMRLMSFAAILERTP